MATNKSAAYREAWALCNDSERIMLDALLAMKPQCLDPDERGCFLSDHPHVHISAQFRSKPTAPYVLDFGVVLSVPGLVSSVRVDVECDGHEFHAMTREQVRRDNRRNRHLRALGWHVERFSGSEVWRDANACAAQVAETIDREFALLVRASAEEWWRLAA